MDINWASGSSDPKRTVGSMLSVETSVARNARERKQVERWESCKAGLRAKVEHPFRVIKRQFGYIKVRYCGLAKNTAQVLTLFALPACGWRARNCCRHRTTLSRGGGKGALRAEEQSNCSRLMASNHSSAPNSALSGDYSEHPRRWCVAKNRIRMIELRVNCLTIMIPNSSCGYREVVCQALKLSSVRQRFGRILSDLHSTTRGGHGGIQVRQGTGDKVRARLVSTSMERIMTLRNSLESSARKSLMRPLHQGD